MDIKVAFKVHPVVFICTCSSTETTPNTYAPVIPLAQDLSYFLMYINGFFENYSTRLANPLILTFQNKNPFPEEDFRYIDLETTTHDLKLWKKYLCLSCKKLTGAQIDWSLQNPAIEMAGDDTTGIDGNTRNVLHTDWNLQSNPNTYKIQFKNRNTIWITLTPQIKAWSILRSYRATLVKKWNRGIQL